MSQYGKVSDTLRDLVKLGKVFPAGWADPDTDRNNALRDAIAELRLAAGINPILEVNDCQTIGDWSEETDGTFDVTADTTNEKIGDTAILLTNTASTATTNKYIETSLIMASKSIPNDKYGKAGGIDWTEYDWFGGWWYGGGANHFDGASELQLNIKNAGVWGTAVDIVVPTGSTALPPQVPTNAVHKRFDVDITSFARDKVQAIRFIAACPTAAQNVSIDDLIVYKYSTGRGPLIVGGAAPMIPANGTSISRGDIVSYSSGIIHRIEEESGADQVDDVGVCVIPATGDISAYPPKVAWITKTGALLYLRANAATVAGEALIWQSESATEGHLVQGGATGADEVAFAKGFEAAGAQYDDILAQIARAPAFIS